MCSKVGKWVTIGPRYAKVNYWSKVDKGYLVSKIQYTLDNEEGKEYKRPPDDDPAAPLSGAECGARPGWGGKCENTARCHTWL